MTHTLVLLVHLFAAIFWVGGMAVILFCVRPAALATLEPPQPITLLHATMQRFLRYVGIAVILLVATGIHLYGLRGGGGARIGIHVMAAGGIAMALLYGHIRFAVFKKLNVAVGEKNWADAKKALEQLRRMVLINFCLAVTIIIAVRVWA